MIELRGVIMRYPGAASPALCGVEWTVADGELAVVAGPSGSGKSTLLRCLNGLVPHMSGGAFGGVAVVAGHDITRYGPRTLSRVTGFVFQEPDGQAVAGTVEDEIAFSMEQLGVAPVIMRTRVEEMLDLLGLAQLRRRSVTTLSGGERQRIAIAAAMALHPPLLVLDEPTSQLDPWGADDVINALGRLNADLNVTIVIAEHRLERLLPVLDSLTWVEDGQITASGELDDVVSRLPEVALPPMVALARRLRLDPVPRTIKECKRALSGWTPPLRLQSTNPIGDPAIIVRDLEVRLENRSLLSGVDLTAHSGEIIALMGRNGSGKTTLLRTLFGFIEPARGQIEVAGLNMRECRPAELGARAAYLPQRSGSVLFNETVRDEIAFTVRHRPGTEWPDWLVDAFGLADLLDRDPRDLSEGQRLRSALAAVLAGEPRVVLLDEPTRGMDGYQKQQLAAVLRELRQRGSCVLLATHDVELAAALADRVVLLGHGEVIADGTPAEVLSGSMAFSTQINRLFGPGYLTLDDLDLTEAIRFGDTFRGLADEPAISASG